jgi:CBS domain-containing protein
LTDRDVAIRCVARGLDTTETTVGQVMTKSLHTVAIDQGLFDVVRVMRENRVRRIPVLDETGKAVGLLSFGDLFQLLGKEMSDLEATISPEFTKIEEIAA